MKANLARFATAIALLTMMAMSLGAGMRWSLESIPVPWDMLPWW